MRLDEKLLEGLKPQDSPILHFYDFEGAAATYGYFLKPELFLNERHGLDLARRPTGGGILFHLWDLTFSVLIPEGHFGYSKEVMRNYRFINDLVVIGISNYLGISVVNLLPEDPLPLDEASGHFCFAKPTKYDVMMDGKKVAGAAQRRKKNGFLHQGSISLIMPDFAYLQTLLRPDTLVLNAMKMHTFAIAQGNLTDAKNGLRASLQKVITQI